MTSPSPETIPTAVFDASPLVFLTVLDYTDLLPDLFGVIVASQVAAELRRKPGAPGSGVLAQPWLSVQAPEAAMFERVGRELGAGAGETASIALALKLSATVVLDDQKARRYAREKDVAVVGTLGILVLIHRTGRAKRAPEAEFALLEARGMWLSERLRESVMRELNAETDA